METKLPDEQRKKQLARTALQIVIGLISMLTASYIIWLDVHSLFSWISASGILWAAALWQGKIAAWVYPEHAT